MTWAKFDDVCPEHPKVAKLSDAAHRLWFNAVCYSTKMLTDGRIEVAILKRLYPKRQLALADELVKAGLWHEVSDGYDIHDFLTYQPARAVTLKKRAEDSARKTRGIRPESKRPVPVPSRPPTTTTTTGDRYFRAFGHEGTPDQISLLESYIATHPEACVDWVFAEVAGAPRPGIGLLKFLFNECGLGHKPHGPREKPHAASQRPRETHSTTTRRSDKVRGPAVW